jgi:outer membrane protein assembly factor BamB
MIDMFPWKTLPILLQCWLLSLPLTAGDWTFWRGPNGDGASSETELPETWSPDGENLAWKVPFGGRSAPIVMNGRVFLQNAVGAGETLRERVMCFDADSGELLWEHRFNVYLSDVPTHRVGWPSPTGDPIKGNVYVFGVGGHLLALTADGGLLWERSLGEDFGLITTHGGRTVSPVVVGDLVIVSGLNSGWGDQSRGGHRFFAFDKSNGDLVWVSSPGQRPYDTTYSPPIVRVIDDIPQLIAGAGDGAVHGLKLGTGEPLWRYEISKRGLNSGAVLRGGTAFVSHSEENLDTSVMGMIAAFDATARGELGEEHVKWSVTGFTAGFSSPVIHEDRLYQIDNSANLAAWDLESGERLWTQGLGTIQKASPVLADGKLYVGTENGRFYILRPSREDCEILSEVWMGSQADPEPIIGSVAVSGGRIYLVTSEALYAIGAEPAAGAAGASPRPADPLRSTGDRPPTDLLVVPGEVLLKAGQSVSLRARLFDEQGRFVREAERVSWILRDLTGEISEDGTFTASDERVPQAGIIEASVEGVRGTARVRVIPPLPWKEDFANVPGDRVPPHWVNATGKYEIREMEGGKVLVKLADNPFTKRARTFLGPTDWSDYTVEVDVRAEMRRRQMGDAGVVAQRYGLVLFGNHQRLELQPWQPETERTVTVPFSWEPDTWYRLKLRVENLEDGRTRALGKAWPINQDEPREWLIERIDPVPNRSGSPGIYADATFEVFFNNLEVRPNR